jgi:DNA modification methylase
MLSTYTAGCREGAKCPETRGFNLPAVVPGPETAPGYPRQAGNGSHPSVFGAANQYPSISTSHFRFFVLPPYFVWYFFFLGESSSMVVSVLRGDCRDVLKAMPPESVHCCVTSPPYWGLRDYGVAGQIGLEETPDAYVAELVGLFREVRRVLRKDGTLWLNLGDSYAGSWGARGRGNGTNAARPDLESKHGTDAPNRFGFAPLGIKPKDLVGIPWMVAFVLRADGWYLRQDIIWSKPNPMPESVTDRCTKAHEYIFLMSKGPRYYYDPEAIKEASEYPDDNRKARASEKDYTDRVVKDRIAAMNPKNATNYLTRNRRSVWTVATQPYSGAHFATFPPALIEPCILAGCPKDGTVLDPFGGAGTTGLVADRLQRNAVMIELNPEYATMAERRIADDAPLLMV